MVDALLTDEALIAQARLAPGTGHAEECLNELFQRYYQRVGLWCLRITGDRESAVDLAQEVFMKAYQHIDTFLGDSRFSTWLYSVARNHCFNYIKSRSRRPMEEGEETLANVADWALRDPLAVMQEQRSLQEAKELLKTVLDDTERRVMYLHYAEEMPLEAITRLLGLENPSGAKAHIVNAKRKLKHALQRPSASLSESGTAGKPRGGVA